MALLRAFLIQHRRLAGLLIVMALAMRVLIPGGYMPGLDGKVLTIQVCADTQGSQITQHIVVPTDSRETNPAQPGKANGLCAFSALGFAALGGADFVLLAGALAFILLLGFAPMRVPRLARSFHILPPLRGPPALA